MKPFLRWAGGKSKVVSRLIDFVPAKDAYDCYFEPFFGAGALFFRECPKRAVLSDLNGDLMNCYQQVALFPGKVWRHIRRHRLLDNRAYYLEVRSQRSSELSQLEQAARFIYLNKAAFNGIYRVNRLGDFNVPYGPSANGPVLPSKEVLFAASSLLVRSKLLVRDYRDVCGMARPGDFIYLDPPYPPTNGTSYFTHYTPSRFSWDDQKSVADTFRELDHKGCLVMMSNSDRKEIRGMFGKFHIHRLNVIRWIGSNGDRFGVYEVVVTNYDPGLMVSARKRR